MSATAWSDEENDAIVETWFAMLIDDLAGRPVNKAAQNRALQEETGRSRGSIEFKHCNISAAAKAFGLPILRGYQPRFNFQMSLAEAISRWLARHPHWDAPTRAAPPQQMAEPEPLFVDVAPTLRNVPPPDELEQMQRVARKFDVAGRDERNRALGYAGEERVLHYERATLRQAGCDDLADRVRWVSQEDGDGAGYDILSFSPEGRERLIEVKTTNGWARTPFHISRNELEVSEERQQAWCLFRLHDFARQPRAFELHPPLAAHVALIAGSYRATFH
ncbi:DUF3883 domain-containing protein [Roseovarius tibetensis]|uniref:DUF3883 domain-containing protein n=1 Tax=Roseovarius tibetensis TaxID=2685897 RepID=UPI003D7FBB1B